MKKMAKTKKATKGTERQPQKKTNWNAKTTAKMKSNFCNSLKVLRLRKKTETNALLLRKLCRKLFLNENRLNRCKSLKRQGKEKSLSVAQWTRTKGRNNLKALTKKRQRCQSPKTRKRKSEPTNQWSSM